MKVFIIILITLLILGLALGLGLGLGLKNNNNSSSASSLGIEPNIESLIKQRTVDFANAVTGDANSLGILDGKDGKIDRAKLITQIFAPNGVLRPTVGQLTRTKSSRPDIFSYFADYFSRSNIPKLQVLNAKHNVVKITEDIYANYAFVQFYFGKGMKTTARMTFLWQKQPDNTWKILLLDSSPLPEVPLPLINNKYTDKFTFPK